MKIDKRTVGMYEKFIVRRTDGTDGAGQKHEGCLYFVLDTTHDRFAIPALEAYAEACASEYPLLAADVRELAEKMKMRAERTGGRSEEAPEDLRVQEVPECH